MNDLIQKAAEMDLEIVVVESYITVQLYVAADDARRCLYTARSEEAVDAFLDGYAACQAINSL